MTLSDPIPAVISRRSGRHTKRHHVLLSKPPGDYKTSDCFTVTIDGRDIPVSVEIPIGPITDILCVA